MGSALESVANGISTGQYVIAIMLAGLAVKKLLNLNEVSITDVHDTMLPRDTKKRGKKEKRDRNTQIVEDNENFVQQYDGNFNTNDNVIDEFDQEAMVRLNMHGIQANYADFSTQNTHVSASEGFSFSGADNEAMKAILDQIKARGGTSALRPVNAPFEQVTGQMAYHDEEGNQIGGGARSIGDFIGRNSSFAGLIQGFEDDDEDEVHDQDENSNVYVDTEIDQDEDEESDEVNEGQDERSHYKVHPIPSFLETNGRHWSFKDDLTEVSIDSLTMLAQFGGTELGCVTAQILFAKFICDEVPLKALIMDLISMDNDRVERALTATQVGVYLLSQPEIDDALHFGVIDALCLPILEFASRFARSSPTSVDLGGFSNFHTALMQLRPMLLGLLFDQRANSRFTSKRSLETREKVESVIKDYRKNFYYSMFGCTMYQFSIFSKSPYGTPIWGEMDNLERLIKNYDEERDNICPHYMAAEGHSHSHDHDHNHDHSHSHHSGGGYDDEYDIDT